MGDFKFIDNRTFECNGIEFKCLEPDGCVIAAGNYMDKRTEWW